MPFTFSPETGRYRDVASGRLVSEAKVRLAVDAAADAASEHLARLSVRLMTGELRLAEWQMEAMRTIRLGHVATATVAHGGRAQMAPADWGFIGQRIRQEYSWLRDFANGMADGSIPIDGRVMARSALYGQACRSTFTAMTARDQRGRGAVSERNMLGSTDQHCAECVGQSALGWQPIGTLIPPGSRSCVGNCRCRLIYSKVEAVAA